MPFVESNVFVNVFTDKIDCGHCTEPIEPGEDMVVNMKPVAFPDDGAKGWFHARTYHTRCMA